MSKKADLTESLRSAGGSMRRRQPPQPAESLPQENPEQSSTKPYKQPGRVGTKPITAHFPKDVRNQLKILGVEQDKTMQQLMGEALNDLFAKYGKPEIAPTSLKG